MQLVVLQITESSARSCKRVVELIVRIVHLIDTEYGLQTTFIKGLVVSHKGQTLYQGFYLRPYFGEYWCVLSVFLAETMHLRTPIIIIVRLWSTISPLRTMTIPTEQTELRSLFAVSKSIAAKSCIFNPPYIFSTFSLSYQQSPYEARGVRPLPRPHRSKAVPERSHRMDAGGK